MDHNSSFLAVATSALRYYMHFIETPMTLCVMTENNLLLHKGGDFGVTWMNI